MKKIKKLDLRLEKEVISSLTTNDLSEMKGGKSNGGDFCAPDLTYFELLCKSVTCYNDTVYSIRNYTCVNCPTTPNCISTLENKCEPLKTYAQNCKTIYANNCPG